MPSLYSSQEGDKESRFLISSIMIGFVVSKLMYTFNKVFWVWFEPQIAFTTCYIQCFQQFLTSMCSKLMISSNANVQIPLNSCTHVVIDHANTFPISKPSCQEEHKKSRFLMFLHWGMFWLDRGDVYPWYGIESTNGVKESLHIIPKQATTTVSRSWITRMMITCTFKSSFSDEIWYVDSLYIGQNSYEVKT